MLNEIGQPSEHPAQHAHLRARGGVWAEELGAGRAFRVAVNQSIVALDTALPDNAEVAIFPPVTGG